MYRAASMKSASQRLATTFAEATEHVAELFRPNPETPAFVAGLQRLETGRYRACKRTVQTIAEE